MSQSRDVVSKLHRASDTTLNTILEILEKREYQFSHTYDGLSHTIVTASVIYTVTITTVGRYVQLIIRRSNGESEEWDFNLVPIFGAVPRKIKKQIENFL